MSAAGLLVGAAAAGGLLMIAAAAPPLRPVRLADRIAPYVGQSDGPPPQRWWRSQVARFASLGGAAAIQRRLARAGHSGDVAGYRLEQAQWAGAAELVAVPLALALLARGHWLTAFALPLLVAPAAGVGARTAALSAQITRREHRLLMQLPALADLVSLAVTAGESVGAALGRAADIVGGELGAELRATVDRSIAGTPIVVALDDLSRRTALPALGRFVDGLVVAIERGTPLAEVLRAQAADVRNDHRRALIEAAGRKEVAMLVPVVFLVLPVTVVFALFPGLAGLSLTVS